MKGFEVVYFIASGETVKVGRTTDLRARLMALQTANPVALRLVGAIPGGAVFEASAHAELSSFRISGEWFQFSTFSERMIEKMLSRGGVLGTDALSLTDDAPRDTLDEEPYIRQCKDALDDIVRYFRNQGQTVAQCLASASRATGISYSAAWALQYRRPKHMSAAQYFALLDVREKLACPANIVEAEALVARLKIARARS